MPEYRIDDASIGAVNVPWTRLKNRGYTIDRILDEIYKSIRDQLPMEAFHSKWVKLQPFQDAAVKPTAGLDLCVGIINEIREEQARNGIWKSDGSVILVPKTEQARIYAVVNGNHNPIGFLHTQKGTSSAVLWTTSTPVKLGEISFTPALQLIMKIVDV